jgi:DNA uptake protein ComE-like DNA-binding protein/soluble cytochrome b562
MNSFKSYFIFTRTQRNGLLVLITLMLSLQLCYYFIDFSIAESNPVEKRQWLALQHKIDSVQKITPEKQKHYLFNPNFITDYKGYKLGMSVAEIDRLHAFRNEGRFVNSAREFQAVTKVSDSLLTAMAIDFKFPDWVTKKQSRQFGNDAYKQKMKIPVIDINAATKEELMAVYGIGDALSDRILKQKEILGGFVSMAQMEDVWGLQPEVVDKIKARFNVSATPTVTKIKINDASISALAKFPYFRYALAKEIVTYRSMNGAISGIADLTKIKNFPIEKVEIIAVYLEF